MAKRALPIGKVEPRLLQKIIFRHLGISDPRVLLPPAIGEDATVIEFGNRALVIHSDPITGAIENLGWLAVNVCTNDIAARGVRPLWILTVLLMPKGLSLSHLEKMTAQIDQASKNLGVAVVGGHSEITSSVNHPVIITTAVGEAVNNKFVRTSGARPGDTLILTKGAAIEGTAILSNELSSFLRTRLDAKTVNRGKHFITLTSVVKEALTSIEVADSDVHAMHDATEGGVAGALQEIAWASNAGLIAYEEKIPVYPETRAICKALQIDPLKTISSGTLVISVESKASHKIVDALKRNGIPASVIGKMLEKREGAYVIRKNGAKLDLSKPIEEELWKAFKKASLNKSKRYGTNAP